ncbi:MULTISPECIES: phosphate ABC transporter permease [unclassified Halorubrum]|uniref:phosphate ABC transporter permease n=1 Tax=unclassified Halorubrum TaxID=2642239 RepID=UPI000B97FE4A|nr:MULTISPECIES: phosphate ABC transporter permease [unclassified Halorubrum]OYR38109.1 phosphate ABC transporter permease [Halorubrum sp. Hd13]OYR49400.1 phosphate ABC transporter permease [Halorubrum sp. Ea1]OYR51164.1 phosphate ABC transporter permease [Halorubrum sp. Ea8]
MLTPVNAGLVLAGLLLAFVGAAVSVYAVTLTGLLVGGGAGYLAAPSLAGVIAVDGLVLTGVAVAIGAAVGGFLAYAGLSFAVVAIGGLVGGFAGRFAVGPLYAADAAGVEGTLLLVGATLAGVAVGALFGFVLSRTTLVVSTAFIGAAFASRSLTPATLDAAAAGPSVEPLLFDVTAPAFLAVFALGALSQLGLFRFGYVTKLVGLLPGARRWTADDDRTAKGA